MAAPAAGVVVVVDRYDAWLVVAATLASPVEIWLWVVGLVLLPEGPVSVAALTACLALLLGELWLSRRHPPIADRTATRRNLPGACAFVGWSDRSPRRLIIGTRAVWWAAILLVIAAVGERLLSSGVGRWVATGVVLFFAVVVVPLVVIDAHLSRRRFVRALSAGEFTFEPDCGDVPTNIDAVVAELQSFGFRELSRGRWVVAHHPPTYEVRLVRSDGIVACAASRGVEPKRALPSFRSLLGNRLGVLGTQTRQGSLSAANELTQVFPQATTAELLAHHEGALAFLARHHIDAMPLADEQVPEFVAWDMMNSGVNYSHGRGVLRRLIFKSLGRVEDRGPIDDHADTLEKIATIQSA